MSISQLYPEEGPTLNLNFAGSRTLDPRITFSRTTSATRVNELGLIEVVPANAPRFDHRYENGVVRSLGLLIEEQSSNLLPYSVVSTLTWSSINSSIVTNNAATAPDGTNTAARIQVDTSGFVAVLNISVTAGQPYTFSFWVKSVSGSSGTWGINIFDHGGGGFHNRTTRNITGEWTRISYTYTPVGNQINIYVSDDRNLLGTILDGYVWGVQLEQKSFATSLIPTSGSTATRNPDNVSMTGENFLDWYNPTEGTVYADTRMVGVQTGRYDRLWAITNSNLNLEGISIFVAGPAGVSGGYVSSITITNSATEQIGGTLVESAITTPNLRSAFAFKQNDCASAYNGQQRFVDSIVDLSSFTTPLDRLLIGRPQRFQGYSCMTVSQLTYYPRRLTNSQLQNLTK